MSLRTDGVRGTTGRQDMAELTMYRSEMVSERMVDLNRTATRSILTDSVLARRTGELASCGTPIEIAAVSGVPYLPQYGFPVEVASSPQVNPSYTFGIRHRDRYSQIGGTDTARKFHQPKYDVYFDI